MPKKWGNFNYKSFEKLAKRFEDVDKISEQLMIDILHEVANRILRKTKKRTPVGVYEDHTGGELRRNWYISDVKRKGNDIYIEIYNPTEYGPYVEYGHRQEVGRYVPAIGKRLKKPWVEGKFMLTISMKEVEAMIPKIADRHVQESLRGLFDD